MITDSNPLAAVAPDTLDRNLPGVLVLANQLDEMLADHAKLRAIAHGDPDMDLVRDALDQLLFLTTRIKAVWEAAHLVTGAEQQARRTVDGILRGYVCAADRDADTDMWDVEEPAHRRAAERMRELVGDLVTRHYATEKGALP